MLYIVATPIGNLDDITLRALNILKSVSCILCEDTRHTQTLLSHYDIKNKLISYHQHSNIVKIDEIINMLKRGDDLALVTDAGTPCISDPGFVLINKIREELSEIKIFPIPGPSAVVSALSVSGFNLSSFSFLGFIPNKNGREKFIRNICDNNSTVSCFYESCYRILKLLDQIEKIFTEKEQLDRKIFVARELTKMFESYYYGTVQEVREKLLQDPVKGEFVVIIDKT